MDRITELQGKAELTSEEYAELLALLTGGTAQTVDNDEDFELSL